MGIHTMLASSLKIPSLELTEDEATQLAKAVGNVAKYYPVAIDQKTQAWMGLFMVAGSVYGSRAMAWYVGKPEDKPQPKPAVGNVYPLQ